MPCHVIVTGNIKNLFDRSVKFGNFEFISTRFNGLGKPLFYFSTHNPRKNSVFKFFFIGTQEIIYEKS